MPTISIYPDPPVHGELLSVSTDGTIPKALTLTYGLTGGGASVVGLTLTEPKENTTVPDGASNVTIHDKDGECNDVSRIVA